MHFEDDRADQPWVCRRCDVESYYDWGWESDDEGQLCPECWAELMAEQETEGDDDL